MTLNQVALSLLQRELSLAGFSPEDEQRLRELEAFRITPLKELPPVEFLFRLHGKPCFARGELTGLSGKAKSGKTFVCSILMALCFRNEVLSLQRIEPTRLHVLWYDTEQSDESTKDILCQRICQMTGIQQDQFPCEQFDVFNVRQKPVNERLPALEVAVRYRKPDLVILDGLRDLVSDINDGIPYRCTEKQLLEAQYEAQRKLVAKMEKSGGRPNKPYVDLNPKYAHKEGRRHVFDVKQLFTDIMTPGQPYQEDALKTEIYAKTNAVKDKLHDEILRQAVNEKVIMCVTNPFGKKEYLLPQDLPF